MSVTKSDDGIYSRSIYSLGQKMISKVRNQIFLILTVDDLVDGLNLLLYRSHCKEELQLGNFGCMEGS